MIGSARRSATLILAFAAATSASTAFAETISREVPRQPPAVAATAETSPASAMPYTCGKTELATRIQRRSCR